MAKTNINELLERKKSIEDQIAAKLRINPVELKYESIKTIDHTNNKENVFEPRPRITLNDYAQDYNTLVEELAKVKTAITKFNADVLADKLQQREAVRSRLKYFDLIKVSLFKDRQQTRRPSRLGVDGETLETTEVLAEPMFPLKDIEKQMNETAAQERKLNAEIQKLNLNAEVEV